MVLVVKLYHPYIQFPRNVRLSHRQIATFSVHRLINILTSLLTDEFLVDKCLRQFYAITRAN